MKIKNDEIYKATNVNEMDLLPSDILWHYFISVIPKHDIIFVCRSIHKYYKNYIMSNGLVKNRYDRVNKCEIEAHCDGYGVCFDRGYVIKTSYYARYVTEIKLLCYNTISAKDINIYANLYDEKVLVGGSQLDYKSESLNYFWFYDPSLEMIIHTCHGNKEKIDDNRYNVGNMCNVAFYSDWHYYDVKMHTISLIKWCISTVNGIAKN